MRQACIAALLAVVIAFAAPILIPTPAVHAAQTDSRDEDTEAAPSDEGVAPAEAGLNSREDAAPTGENTPAADVLPVSGGTLYDDNVLVNLTVAGETRELTLAQYLAGVVAGELTGAFGDDALRAQAVAARTYALNCMASDKHEGGLCGESGCCQNWADPAEKSKTAAGAALVERARTAVAATDGQVLMYDGQLIEAVYFSCSGGRTEAAKEVWGGEIPYLQAVDSPGEEYAPRYEGEAAFTAQALRNLLEPLGADLSGEPVNWFGVPTYTQGGGVAELTIGGTSFSGTRLRTLLGLNATCFTVTVSDDTIIFRTRGFGHRVGLSQYGADAMARAGHDWREILAHYYTGAALVQLEA